MISPARILIVDDSPEDCAIYRRHLERGGKGDFSFLISHSAAAGLQMCVAEKPDCILLDFNLPDSDGLEFLTALHAQQGEMKPPVVMVTGQGNEAVAVRALKLGAQDYLVKGQTADGLRHAILSAIETVSLRRKLEAQQQEVARLSASQAELLEELGRRADELSEADRRKNEFLAVLAHELRNPLGPIRNAAEIIRLTNATLSPDAEKARMIIDRQVGHMARLIDDLLDVSRIVRGKVALRKERIDLGALVRMSVEDHRGEFADHGLSLALELPPSETWVDGDPTRLSQVLGNILDNSRKFTPRGGAVEVSLCRVAADATAVIRVADSGEGLDREMLERMFEVFSQADRSLDRSRGGLGLGLAIVKGLVELHGGNVTASSAGPGRGCEILVTLRLAETTSAANVAPASESPDVRNIRVMVVEDNKDAADGLGLLLQTLGHEVSVVYNGHDALETAREFRPELILCDIGLADGMSGYEVAERMRADRDLASAYLVALTGYGRSEDQERASLAGFDLHLTKPIALDTLKALPSRVPNR